MSECPIPTSYPSEAGIFPMSLTLKKMVPLTGISYDLLFARKAGGVLWEGVIDELPLENSGSSDTDPRETSIRIY